MISSLFQFSYALLSKPYKLYTYWALILCSPVEVIQEDHWVFEPCEIYSLLIILDLF